MPDETRPLRELLDAGGVDIDLTRIDTLERLSEVLFLERPRRTETQRGAIAEQYRREASLAAGLHDRRVPMGLPPRSPEELLRDAERCGWLAELWDDDDLADRVALLFLETDEGQRLAAHDAGRQRPFPIAIEAPDHGWACDNCATPYDGIGEPAVVVQPAEGELAGPVITYCSPCVRAIAAGLPGL